MQLSIYIIYIALTMICLSYKKHFKQVFGSEASLLIKYTLLCVGFIMLIVSAVVATNIMNLSIGLTYWLFALCPIIILIAILLSYQTRLLMPLLGLSILGIAIQLLF